MLLLLLAAPVVANTEPRAEPGVLRLHTSASSVNLTAPFPPVVFEVWSPDGLAVGEPPQRVQPFLDTGSDVEWAYRADCTSPVCKCARQPRYAPLRSSAYRPTAPPFNESFGPGTVLLQPGADLLTVTSVTGNRVRLANYNFAGAVEVTTDEWGPDIWCQAVPSGIFGIRGNMPSLATQLQRAGLVPAAVLAFMFGPSLGEKGWVTLGGVEGPGPDVQAPPVWWFDSVSHVHDVTLDRKPVPGPFACDTDDPGPDDCLFTPDSGAGFLSAPVGMRYTIGADCAGFERLPTLGVTLKNGAGALLKLSFTPSDYVHKTAGGCASGLVQLTIVPGGGFSATADSENGPWFLAGRALSVMATVQDFDNQRTGFFVPAPSDEGRIPN